MWFSSSGVRDDGKAEERSQLLVGKLLQSPIPITAYFGQTPATVSDIVNLQIGDVIKLDHSLNEPLTIKVQHIPKFKATIGTLGNRYAMQVVDVIKEERPNESVTR
jgi:flagellar motor switch protein FliM